VAAGDRLHQEAFRLAGPAEAVVVVAPIRPGVAAVAYLQEVQVACRQMVLDPRGEGAGTETLRFS
jgi:hypothetical protein